MVFYNRLKTFWDLLILISTTFFAVLLPLHIVFSIKSLFFDISFLFITIIFIFDIFFNLFYKENKKILLNKNYLKFNICLDIITAIPFELIESISPDVVFIRVLRVLRLFKFYKLSNFIRYIRSKNIFNPAILRMFLMIFWMFLAIHFISCGWMLVGKFDQALTNSENYLRAFYWTLTTMATIGYGDITPSNNIQIIFTIIVEIIGVGMYGFIIGNISSLLANIDIARKQFQEKIERINIFFKYRNIPTHIVEKVNNYYHYLWETRKGYDEVTILGDLPLPMKVELSMFLHKEIIEKVPIFRGANTTIIRRIILNLVPVVFAPGDYIVVEGEIGREMFFISKGMVEVLSSDGSRVALLKDGQFFGEISLLLSVPRTASIRALTFCDMYILDKETFDNIIRKFPEFEMSVKKLAEERKKELEEIYKKKWG